MPTMDGSSRRGASAATQLNWLMFFSLVIPAAAVLGLGFWIIGQAQAANAILPETETLMWSVTFGAAIVAVVCVAFAWLRGRSLVKAQALELADACRQVAAGERAMRVPAVGEDEFAVLAAAVNSVLDGAPTRSGAGSPDGQDAATLQAQIEKLLQEVSAVGDGDLRVQAEVTPDTLGVLADSFNYMIEELAKVVGRVQNTAVQVTNASRRVLDRSAELAQASETQVARISQAAHAVEALATFVQDVAHNARVSAEASQEALKNAKTGQSSVRQSIEGMVLIRENVQETSKKIKRLGERSNEIAEIVRIIEDIADQT